MPCLVQPPLLILYCCCLVHLCMMTTTTTTWRVGTSDSIAIATVVVVVVVVVRYEICHTIYHDGYDPWCYSDTLSNSISISIYVEKIAIRRKCDRLFVLLCLQLFAPFYLCNLFSSTLIWSVIHDGTDDVAHCVELSVGTGMNWDDQQRAAENQE